MKIYEKTLLILFGFNCIASLFLNNWNAALGWGSAFMLQLRVMKYIKID